MRTLLLTALLFGTATLFAQEPAVRILAINPVEKTLERIVEQPARIEAYAVAPLHARVAGYIADVRVEIGQKVAANEQLLTISAPDLELELRRRGELSAQATVQLEQARQDVVTAENGIQSATQRVARTKSLSAKYEADVSRWNSELERITKLAASAIVPDKVRDESRRQAEAAVAEWEAAKAAERLEATLLTAAENQLAAAKLAVKAAEVKVRLATVEEQAAAAQFAYTTISAPFAGSIAQRAVDPGHLVTGTGQRAAPLLTVVRTDRLRIVIDVPETEAGLLAPEQAVTIRIPTLPDAKLVGKLTRVAPALHPETRVLTAELEWENADNKLKPGLFAHAAITTARRDKCLVVPASAVASDAGKSFCLAIRDGKIARVDVQTGLRAGVEVEILAGISTTDWLIPKNLANYIVGQAAEVVPPVAK